MSIKNKIANIETGIERAFFHEQHVEFDNVRIDGVEDGESSFKECKFIEVRNSYFNLRYPFWHDFDVYVSDSTFTDNARAAFWYCSDVVLVNVKSTGIKAVRECKDVVLKECEFISPEFGWKTSYISVFNSKIVAEYGFFLSNNVTISNLEFAGKYSFQYVEEMVIADSNFDTKDAFWHSENVVVKNTILKGEYLGWYSINLTLINCVIIGTQPLCYCKGLQLIDCKFIDCDLAFEYSEVNGNIIGEITSIKNPASGKLVVDKVGEFIEDENSRKIDFVLEINDESKEDK